MTETPDAVGAGGKPSIGRGLYGLKLAGIGPETGHLLTEAPASWPLWSVDYGREVEVPPLSWSDERAVLPLQPDGRAVIDRGAHTTTLLGVEPDDAALLHPYFGSTALSYAAWCGRLTLHGGVLATPSGSWGVLGEREAGKSSALAWWVGSGAGVVADDLVVTDAETVFAGPRFVDLRESAHEHFGLGADAGVLGTRRRWRVPLDAVPAQTPFAGLVELAWGDEVAIEVVPMVERFEVVHRHRGLQLPIDIAQQTVLGVLTKPMLRFTRPKSWPVLDDAMRRLGDALAAY